MHINRYKNLTFLTPRTGFGTTYNTSILRFDMSLYMAILDNYLCLICEFIPFLQIVLTTFCSFYFYNLVIK